MLGYFSHPDERPGKVFVFPHLFAEVMDVYMEAHGVTEEDLAAIAVAGVRERAAQPLRPDAEASSSRSRRRCKIEGINRYIVEGLPLKTYDCSQITDGYAALILATEEGLARLGVAKADCVRDRRLRPGDRPAARRRAATCCGRRAPTPR